jgi:alpha-tubulin suppressor-like RCC1 family protein
MDHRVANVCGGSVHTCVLTDLGEVYSFGKYEYTGLGTRDDVLFPRKLEALTRKGITIKRIAVGPGGYHTVALSEKGEDELFVVMRVSYLQ